MANEKILQVVDLCKSFHKLDVLKHISVDFEKNEVVSIIGPSGGGKSTFLRCLNLLETPTSGQILFDGVDICARGRASTSTSTVRRWAWCSSSSTSSTT